MTVNETKPIAITLTNHNRIEKEQYDEPIRISNNYLYLAQSAGKSRLNGAIGFGFASH